MVKILCHHSSACIISKLSRCSELSWLRLISGCNGGVFVMRHHRQPWLQAKRALLRARCYHTSAPSSRYLVSVASLPHSGVEPTSSKCLTPPDFLDEVDEKLLLACSPTEIYSCLLQLSYYYFEHLATLFPWLLSHHHDIYKQLSWSGKLEGTSKVIRHHPKFKLLCHRLEHCYRDCSDQELSSSLLLLLYLGVRADDSLTHKLLFEVMRRIPSMNIQALTAVSWVSKALPGHELITRSSFIQEHAAACSQPDSLAPEDVCNLCVQQANYGHLMSQSTTDLCRIVLGRAEDEGFFTEGQHLADVASYFARPSMLYHLEKHDLLKRFKSWMAGFKRACITLIDDMTDQHIGCTSHFLKSTYKYDPEIRKLFERQSLRLLPSSPGIGKLTNLITSLSPSSSKNVVWPFEERFFNEVEDADDYVAYMLVSRLFGTKHHIFGPRTLRKFETVLAERDASLLPNLHQASEILILLGRRHFLSRESGVQFSDILLENIVNKTVIDQDYVTLISAYLLSRKEFLVSSVPVYEIMEQSVYRCTDSCALQMFSFLNYLPRDCQNGMRSIERHIHARLLRAISDTNDLFHLCYLVKGMLAVDDSFKFRDRMLADIIIQKLERLLATEGDGLTESTYLSAIDVVRRMKSYAPKILDSLVDHFCANADLHKEKIVVRLLCTLSIYSHRSKTVNNFIPSVIKLINAKSQLRKYKDVMLMLNYLMRLQICLEDELRQMFSFDFMAFLAADCDYAEDPARIVLVELTRRCLLEHPELDIPWFHDDYCRSNIVTGEPKSYRAFRDGVASALKHVLGGKEYFKRWNYTPYFYSIDFECILDEGNRPINMKTLSPGDIRDTWQRVAILLHTQSSFWLHSDHLRGSVKDKTHHLELMGYKVIEVNHKEWFSTLADKELRVNHLRDQLFSSLHE